MSQCPDGERIIQIGEGRFLRGFADWIVHRMNESGDYQAKVVVVAPRPTGRSNIEFLNRQGGTYSVWIRGYENGTLINRKEGVSSISRGIDPYTEWASFLTCADNWQIRTMISNTTEAGISYVPEPYHEGSPISSFPGKVTAYLHRRYQTFSGQSDAGMVIIPTELVENNGHLLREFVLRCASEWGLPKDFMRWVKECNSFCNTLVDRIVTLPDVEDREQMDELGLDELAVVAEPYYLWAIESADRVADTFLAHVSDANIHLVDDITPFRLRKVRILNGAHTALAAVGLLAGLTTVKEVMTNELTHHFVSRLIFDEIIPSIPLNSDLDSASLHAYGRSVLERFSNPFIKHRLKDIATNSFVKARTRLVPTVQFYGTRGDGIPPCLTAGISALLLLYSPYGLPDCVASDSSDEARQLKTVWGTVDGVGLRDTVINLCGLKDVWGQDLTALHAVSDQIFWMMQDMKQNGIENCLRDALSRT